MTLCWIFYDTEEFAFLAYVTFREFVLLRSSGDWFSYTDRMVLISNVIGDGYDWIRHILIIIIISIQPLG